MSGSKPSSPCPFCHGSGQISSFKGVSRFLLTTEECPYCCGTGQETTAAKKETGNRHRRKKHHDG